MALGIAILVMSIPLYLLGLCELHSLLSKALLCQQLLDLFLLLLDFLLLLHLVLHLHELLELHPLAYLVLSLPLLLLNPQLLLSLSLKLLQLFSLKLLISLVFLLLFVPDPFAFQLLLLVGAWVPLTASLLLLFIIVLVASDCLQSVLLPLGFSLLITHLCS